MDMQRSDRIHRSSSHENGYLRAWGLALLAVCLTLAFAESAQAQTAWTHLTSKNGDLPVPNGGDQQTATAVFDVDGDGVNDFFVTDRSTTPSVVWYRRHADGWDQYVVEDEALRIEAGSAHHDIDGDGDTDVVFGGDSSSDGVWWWENPAPDFSADASWTRHLIARTPANKHHDQLFGDFDGDGQAELVYWNQGAQRLFLAEIPDDPTSGAEWPTEEIYRYSADSQMEQTGTYPSWKGTNEHEGLNAVDIDGDGMTDIVGGGRWFSHAGNGEFVAHVVDASYPFSRAVAGDLIEGGRPEIVMVAGDGQGPLRLYEYQDGTWVGQDLLPSVRDGHSIGIVDFNRDGYLDVFNAEMRLGSNPDAKSRILLGDGEGTFQVHVVSQGYGHHEAKIADLDGDGDHDTLAKPYTWDAPRIDVWLNEGGDVLGRANPGGDWGRYLIDPQLPERSVYVKAGDVDGDGRQDLVAGGWWYRNPGSLGGAWTRNVIGAPLNNMAAAHDFDDDGDLDVLGTKGVGANANPDFVWARNDGQGDFTVLENIPDGEGDFLQGVAVERFQEDGPLQVALSWHAGGQGVQMLTVPADPSAEQWSWHVISEASQDEDLSPADLDGDGDLDLFQGTQWIENPGTTDASWPAHPIGSVTEGDPDRNEVADFNGDGRLDAVVGLENGDDVLLFLAPVDPTQSWTRRIIASGVGGGFSMDAGDMDGDGDPDVVLGEHRGDAVNRVLMFENVDGASEWTQHVLDSGRTNEIDHHDGTQLVDLDGDDDLDLISIGWYNPKVWVYENR